MATKREYLISLDLAKPGRGKFSAKGNEAIAEALAKGIVFDDPVKPAPKPKVSLEKAAPSEAPKPGPVKPAPVVGLTAPAPKPQGVTVNAKEVRSWAKQNGHEVGERGRLNPVVIQAFLNAGGKPSVPAAKPVAVAVKQPRIRPQNKMFGLVRRGDHPKFVSEPVLAITYCYSCKNRVGYCPCATGPVMPKWAGGEVASVTRPTV